MGLLELFILAVGLSMDAFAVSVCKGLSTQKLKTKHYLIIGAWFGGFQALMPTIGYFLGSTFEKYITSFDHGHQKKIDSREHNTIGETILEGYLLGQKAK